MKNLALQITLALCVFVTGCEVQSDITKKSLEKYQPTPTPEKVVIIEEPIEPADIITADTTTEGTNLSVSRDTDRKKLNCDKYNTVTVNGNGHNVEIKGACSQITINGYKNQVVAVAASEIIVNGSQNEVQYSKYVNGKKPIVKDSNSDNTISKQ